LKGCPPLRTPTVQTCKITELMSTPDQRWTVHFTWSPGAYKLPTAPGGSWRRDFPGWEKAENKFTATSGLRVCVSCVAYIYARLCSSVSCVPLKNLIKVLIIKLLLTVLHNVQVYYSGVKCRHVRPQLSPNLTLRAPISTNQYS